MNDKHTYCVIMAGGIGSRFWPMSRTSYPKQFLDFLGLGRTLIQQTFDRFKAICPVENILVVTNAQYAPLVKQQLPELRDEQILLEPGRRNTAPCIAYANHVIAARDPEARIIVAPSDHLVTDTKAFQDTVRLALEQASKEDDLVTLGIVPHRPDTGYGYIQFETGAGAHPRVKRVRTFTEKPDHATALRFLESGDFLWNSGIFIWSLKSIRKAFNAHLPAMEELFSSDEAAYGTDHQADFIGRIYDQVQNISIDYGILEKAANVHVVTSDFGWSDLGTWGSLYEQLPKDTAGNAAVGKHVKLYECANNMVHVQDDRLVVLQGLDDHIVVSTKDALLVCRKRDEQEIKRFVAEATAEWGERFV